jgi:hypothetical protein
MDAVFPDPSILALPPAASIHPYPCQGYRRFDIILALLTECGPAN